ncbi:hypothetical protein L1887_05493 [Cichorium endivia]|nr:hypothetical protein L1887_05493 [Cichorium endivia]
MDMVILAPFSLKICGDTSSEGVYGVYAIDHLGFGLSEGLHGCVPNFDDIVDNVIEQFTKIKDPNISKFLYEKAASKDKCLKLYDGSSHYILECENDDRILEVLGVESTFDTTLGGLLNATCGNATELIIALFALHQRKIHVLKYSLLGSIISNLLLVLGSSLLCGGIANLNKEQRFDRKQVDANSSLLLLGLLCQILPLLVRYGVNESAELASSSVVELSRASSIVLLIAYAACLFFQLKIHRLFFEQNQEEGNDEEVKEEEAVIGFYSAFVWLITLTVIIAILSEYVVDTIEVASDTWGISVRFISIILLPIVGNAAEHAGHIFGCSHRSASQISTFLLPLCVIVAWIMGIPLSMDFGVVETGCLAFSILLTVLTLQDGSSHYLKGLMLVLAYVVIGACFFVQNVPSDQSNANDLGIILSSVKLGSSSA